MSRPDRIHTLTAIVPCNDLDTSEAFYNRLGFWQDPDAEPDTRYLPNAGRRRWCGDPPDRRGQGWVVPDAIPFAFYLYTCTLTLCCARSQANLVIEPSRAPEHKEWGMYECSLSDPDGVLVRVGWPSRCPPSGNSLRPVPNSATPAPSSSCVASVPSSRSAISSSIVPLWSRDPTSRYRRTSTARPAGYAIPDIFCRFDTPIAIHSPLSSSWNPSSLDHAHSRFRLVPRKTAPVAVQAQPGSGHPGACRALAQYPRSHPVRCRAARPTRSVR